jgi:putative PIN family toxin of toxin-antitoxin system
MSGLRRVVFDTSTLVSAALRAGSVPSQALLHALGSGDVCASAGTLAELEMVLRRRKFNRYLDSESRMKFVALARLNVRLFAVADSDLQGVKPRCRDANDNQFLALAQVAEADAIVSSDDDLLILHPWCEIPILSPADFLASAELTRKEGK